MNRRLISVLAALAVGFSGAGALPAGAVDNPGISADAKIVRGGPCGEKVFWDYYSDGTLVFSGSGEMCEVFELNKYTSEWEGFHKVGDIKKVIIEEGITNIVNTAFFFCPELESVSIPSSVTNIGWAAFYRCPSLESIDIPNGTASIEDNAFFNCTSLASVSLPNSVKTIGKMAFDSCPNLKSVKIPASVKEIGEGAFGYDSYVAENKIKGFTITGYSGTPAEKYAKDNGFKFISLGNITGDLNGDGNTDVDDLVLTQKAAAGWKIDDTYKANADINKDGSVDVDDLVLMQKIVAGWKVVV